MQNELQFDFNKAQDLAAVLQDCRSRLAIAAKNIKTAAPAPTCLWWHDEAQKAYAERFLEALPNMDDYERIVDDTLNYLKKVSFDKSEFEKRGKNRFK